MLPKCLTSGLLTAVVPILVAQGALAAQPGGGRSCDPARLQQLKSEAVGAKRTWRDSAQSGGFMRFDQARRQLFQYATGCQADLGIDLAALAKELEGGVRAAGIAEPTEQGALPAADAEADRSRGRAAERAKRENLLPPTSSLVAGPDAFGYTVRDNVSDRTLNPNFIDINVGGTIVNNNNNDTVTGPIAIGFNFDFYTINPYGAGAYTQVWIDDNGLISFSDPMGIAYPVNQCPVNPALPDNFIGVFWDDLRPDLSGRILTQTIGAAPNRIFIVQWNNVDVRGTGQNIKVQAQLLEGTNDIRIEYRNAGPANPQQGNSATFGIKAIAGADELIYGCNTGGGAVNDNSVVLYDYPDISDLSIAKIAPANAIAGDTISYFIEVLNNGPNEAIDVFVEDLLPAGLHATAANIVDTPPRACTISTPPGGQSAGRVTCNLGRLAADPTSYRLIRIDASIDPDATGVVQNQADVNLSNNAVTVFGAAQIDPDPSNNTALAATTLASDADLAVTKTASTANAAAGTDVTFTVTVTNSGLSTATAVVLTDDLSAAGLGYVADDGGCTGAPVLSCNLGDLAPGQSRTVNIIASIPDNAAPCGTNPASLLNTATVSSATADANAANNTASLTLAPSCVADLRIQKFGPPSGPVSAGALLDYTIIVENLGPSFASGVRIGDNLVSTGAFVFTAITLDPTRNDNCLGGCPALPAPGGPIEFTLTGRLEPIGPGGAGRWIIRYQLQAGQAQTITNTATAFNTPAGSNDPDLSNNTQSTQHQITDAADLALTKTATATADAGVASAVTYVLTVTNNGPSTASGVSVHDLIPSGVTVVSATIGSGMGSCNLGTPGNAGNRLVCNLAPILSAAADTVTIVATIDAAVVPGTVLNNDAFVTSVTFDGNPSNDFANAATTVTGSADLVLVKSAAPATPVAGQAGSFSYQITVTNLGPSVATNVVLVDSLPAGVVLESATVVAPGQVGGQPLTCNWDAGLNALVCPLGNVPVTVGTPVIVFLNVQVLPSVADGTVLTNTADATSPTPDPNLPNTATVNVTVVANADLEITKVADDSTPAAGEFLTYTIKVTNHGPSDAQAVTLTDALPASLIYVVDSQGCGAAALAGGTCSFGIIPAGQSRTVIIVATVDPATASGTAIDNTATVATTTIDPDLTNNTATAFGVAVSGAEADLRITKIVSPTVQGVGAQMLYTILVDNLGPGSASNVQVEDLISFDPGTTIDLVTVTPDVGTVFGAGNATCNIASGTTITPSTTMTCTLMGPLQRYLPGNLGRWTIQYTVTSTTPLKIHNTATASSPSSDVDSSNNTATADSEFTASSSSDLMVDKTVSLPTQDAGGPLTYTLLVTNNGPATISNAVVSDFLPAGVVVTNVTPGAGATCTAGVPGDPLRPLVCQLGNLASAASISVTVDVTIDTAVAPGTILFNDAQVTSDSQDTNQGNNLDTVFTTVTRSADLTITKVANPSAIAAGQTTTFIIDVNNLGPSAVGSFLVQDDLPIGLTPVSASVVLGSGTCTVSVPENRVYCNIASLAPGAPTATRIAIVAMADPTANGVLTNTATAEVPNGTTDPNVPNVATANVDVSPLADLSMLKTASDMSPGAGGVLVYLLSVTNNGPSTATGVVVADTLPPNVIYVSDDGGCVGAPALSCAIGTLAPNETRVVSVTVTVDPAAGCGTPIVNSATASAATADTNASNDSSSLTIFVDCGSDLRITKVGSPSNQVATGQTLLYTLTIDNLGPSATNSVEVIDQITASGAFTVDTANIVADAGGTFPGSSCVSSCASCTGSATITCTLVGNLQPFQPGNNGRWIVTIPITATVPQSVNNSATVSSLAPDSDLSNNIATTAHQFADVADLALTKVVDLASVSAGGTLTYTLTVTNNSLTTASGVVLLDHLPAGVQLVSVTGAGLTCTPGVPGDPNFPVTCNAGNVANGAPRTATIVVRVLASVPPGTVLVNGASVSAASYDNDLSNNSANVSSSVLASADLQMLKTASAALIAPGGKLQYTLTVNNLGPSIAGNVTVTDTYPAGLIIDSTNILFGTGSCTISQATSSVICSFASLPVTASAAKILIQATVRPGLAAGTVLTNDVVVSAASSADPVPGNDSASASTTVSSGAASSADLGVAITAARVRSVPGTEPTWVDPGDRVRYTVTVTNFGNGDATNVSVNVALPLGVTWLLDNASCNFDQNGPPANLNGDCDLGIVADGQSVSFYIEVLVDADAAGYLDAVATVSQSPGVDPNPANDLAEATIYASYFDDVLIGHIFWPFVQTMKENAISSGCGGRLFCVDKAILRWEMAVWVERGMVTSFGQNLPVGPGTGLFADVPVGAPGAAFVEELFADGITSGCSLVAPLKYCPNDLLKRSEMAVFLERALILFDGENLPGAATGAVFADVAAGDFAANYIEEFYNDQITGGCASNPLRYCPDMSTTRGQLAVFIARAFGLALP